MNHSAEPTGPESHQPESLKQWVRSLRSFQFEVASRAAVATALPLTVLVLTGKLDWAAYAAFGAMTALFGRNEPYRVRLRTVTVAGTLMVAIIAFALVLAIIEAPLLVLTAGLVVVIVTGILVAATAGLFPATPIFFVFGYAVVAQLPTPADEFWPRLFVAVASAAFAWLLTMSGAVLRRVAGQREPDLYKNLSRNPDFLPGAITDATVWVSVAQNVVGALIAGSVAFAVGIGHPYWAVVSVVAVLPPPGAAHSVSRSLHRMIGTTLGVGIAALVLLPGPPVAVLILVIAAGQFGAEILIGKHYGAALLFVTPLALTVVHLTSPVAVPQLLLDRVLETVLGSVIALIIVLLARAHLRRRRPLRA
ncbi:FUSC family protein [Cryobacterium sp. PH31-O1]|uniref:FUSC family protein n=1 Tax=Cryobacterium sp. PH31-O1 TaxID=3046306 RepID=UPI0024BB0858|nr:FUSC family protein [Cryobacterium sp. PH31-O1]MDJ0337686.1 FUSC family protein [Cryobacterium sp. PH31-O1]